MPATHLESRTGIRMRDAIQDATGYTPLDPNEHAFTSHDGTHLINHHEHTETEYTSDDQYTRYGEPVFLGEDLEQHLAGDLLLVHQDGAREPYRWTPLTPTRDPLERTRQALALTTWSVHVDLDEQEGRLPGNTAERVRQRIREEARTLGLNHLVRNLREQATP